MTCSLTQSFVELELDHEADEISGTDKIISKNIMKSNSIQCILKVIYGYVYTHLKVDSEVIKWKKLS